MKSQKTNTEIVRKDPPGGSSKSLKVEASYSTSPLPPAEELRLIKETDDSIIPWLLKHAEVEQAKRHGFVDKQFELERSRLEVREAERRRSDWMMFGLMMISLAVCGICAVKGIPIGSALAGASGVIVAVAGAFNWHSKRKAKAPPEG